MRAFLAAQGDSIGFLAGLALVVAGVARESLTAALITGGFALCFVFFARIRAGKGV